MTETIIYILIISIVFCVLAWCEQARLQYIAEKVAEELKMREMK